MCDRRSCFGSGECGAAGVGKQIEYPQGPSGLFDFLGNPFPVYGLFREKTGMFEGKRL